MNQPRKYNYLPPPRGDDLPSSPPEIIELNGNSGRTPGTPVELDPACSSLEIIELFPVPRVQLEVVLRITPHLDSAKLTLATAHFISAIQSADRKLRLVVDPARSSVKDTEVMLVLTPAPLGVQTAERLEKVASIAREAVTAFEGATLARVEVIPQS